MTPTALVIILIAAPVAVLMALRVNAVMVFLSLCLGQVLVQFVAGDASDVIGILALGTGKSSPEAISLVLLLLPAVFTTLIMMRTVKGNFKLAMNFLPALSVGVLGLLLAEPHFTQALQNSIEVSEGWNWVNKLETIVVGVSAIMSILFLWLQRPKPHHEDKHGHHK